MIVSSISQFDRQPLTYGPAPCTKSSPSVFARFSGYVAGTLALITVFFLCGCAQSPHQVPAKQSAIQTPVSAAARIPELSPAAATKKAGAIKPPDPVVAINDPLTTSALIERVVARQIQKKRAQAWIADDSISVPDKGRINKAASRGKAARSTRLEGPSRDQSRGSAQVVQAATSSVCAEETPKKMPRRRGEFRPNEDEEKCSLANKIGLGPLDPGVTRGRLVRRADPWETVRNGLVLAGTQHERLVAHLDSLRQRPGTVDFLMTRAEPYLQYLLGEIKRQGLPADLILVPMVESAFQTSALSNKQAAGLWQFIPATGQQYGLQFSETYDGRYDTHSATQAALKYLKRLNSLFNGDWLLAFAAYNAGEGAVQRALQANRMAGGGGTFWELSLPQETQNYVVKILALSKVIADPAGLGFKPHKATSRNTLARVETKAQIKIADLIASSGIAPDDFYKLNPAFKPDVEPPDQPHNFLLPLEKAEILMAANMPGAKIYAPRKVVVQKGDNLSVLAKRHGVPEIKLSEWNGLPPKAPLKVGQEILLLGV
jgi:membrane-bound lytic murein transglycosylase D